MLKKRENPLMTLTEILDLNGVTYKKTKDGVAHVTVESIPLCDVPNPFEKTYLLNGHKTSLVIKYQASAVLESFSSCARRPCSQKYSADCAVSESYFCKFTANEIPAA